MSFFQYLEASPQLRGGAKQFGYHYRRMAVVETETPERPKMISTSAKGVIRIVDEATCHIGSTKRSEGFRERWRLRALAVELQEQQQADK